MFNDITISKKLKLFSGLSLTTLIIIGIFFISEMSSISKLNDKVVQIASLDSELKQLEIDHLNWANEVAKFLVDESIKSFNVEKNFHKCGFGKWFYGKGKKETLLMLPRIKETLQKIEEPHKQLHNSVIELEKILSSGENSRLKASVYFKNILHSYLAEVQLLLKEGVSLSRDTKNNIIKSANLQKQSVFRKSIIMIISFSLLLIIVALFISTSITKLLLKTVFLLKDISEGEGDLTKRLENDDKKTELGELAKYFNLFVVKIQEMVSQSKDNISVLATTSEEQSAITVQIAASTEEMGNQSSTIAASAEQASTNMTNIASSTEEMNISVATVATAIEEMSSTVNEISKNCQQELEIATSANEKSKSTNDMIGKLSVSAGEIGKVLDTIKDIADQTNLLALNATIEAASAGEAGKGFAVVATEVKELARQTAQATDEISKQIEDIRFNTDNSVKAISEITTVIEDVNTISQTIVSAVEEQSATINEISKSVSGVSEASNAVSQNVQESATGLNEISSNISGFHQSIGEITGGMGQVESSTTELARMAETLKASVDKFKV